MLTSVHLRILSPGHARQARSASLDAFPLFAKLPPELRQEIWRTSLLAERTVKLSLMPRIGIDSMINSRGDAITRLEWPHDEPYGVLDENVPALSNIFGVNRESRDVALSHYRIRLPCWRVIRPKTPCETLRHFILYLNPEYDFLRIDAQLGHLADFIHDLKTKHDPHHIGLLNLVLDGNVLRGPAGLISIDPASLEAPQRTSFEEAICQLREIFFLHEQAASRLNLGFYTAPPTCDYRLNRALPAKAMTMGFSRLGADPRPIQEHLKTVFICGDPGDDVRLWNHYIQQHFGSIQARASILMTTFMRQRDVRNRQTAEESLQMEEDAWVHEVSTRNSPGKVIIEGSEHSDVCTAFGFWLLPVDTFDRMPRSGGGPYFDLTEEWPELVLLDLP
ncbi:hypothetical protein F5Y16DRAFT_417355 [Xylariaceae sp. FL0255]|nr:hypothetical protein F5Y16DRAFT_417355 [Xylariaceae sp. FL0255]